MIIGILSDTHGNVKRTRRAIDALKVFKPAQVLHCGDIGSSEIVAELAAGFANPEISVTCVLGNVDGWEDLKSFWPHVQVAGRFAEFDIGGKAVAIVHGDDSRRLAAAVEGGQYDYVFTGHTHERSDDRTGRTRVINPGALHHTREPGCAVLNITTDELRYLSVE